MTTDNECKGDALALIGATMDQDWEGALLYMETLEVNERQAMLISRLTGYCVGAVIKACELAGAPDPEGLARQIFLEMTFEGDDE